MYAILRTEICLAERVLCDFRVERGKGGGNNRETLTQPWIQFFLEHVSVSRKESSELGCTVL